MTVYVGRVGRVNLAPTLKTKTDTTLRVITELYSPNILVTHQ